MLLGMEALNMKRNTIVPLTEFSKLSKAHQKMVTASFGNTAYFRKCAYALHKSPSPADAVWSQRRIYDPDLPETDGLFRI